MLPNNDIVLDTYLRNDGVLKGATKGKILVDSSTTAPSVSKKVFEHASKNNVEFIDAPVSGGKNRKFIQWQNFEFRLIEILIE